MDMFRDGIDLFCNEGWCDRWLRWCFFHFSGGN
jgi:hypothetical protein